MKKYRPRNDFVLFREETIKESEGGVAFPDISSEGKRLTIVAFGPEVKGLVIGDEVLAVGQLGMDLIRLPRENDLYLTKQSNVVLVVKS